MPRIVFITATGTEIGKTLVTASLARHLVAQGLTVQPLKPVASGVDPAALEESDPYRLAAALVPAGAVPEGGLIEAICPWQFEAPLAPHMAAARAGVSLSYSLIEAFVLKSCAESLGTVLVEGVGGVLAPLTEDRTVADLMTAIARHHPVQTVLVAGSYLGTISHTLTALETLNARRLPPAALVISESEESPVPVHETGEAIAQFAPHLPQSHWPRRQDGSFEREAAQLAGQLFQTL